MNNNYHTFLYVKKHMKTGLLYFGKTIREKQFIESYTGSGVYWLKHINAHGKEFVKTIWISEPLYDKEHIKEIALNFSVYHDIVNSDLWANLKNENGLEGGSRKGRIVSEETRQKSSQLNKGKIIPEKTRKLFSEKLRERHKNMSEQEKIILYDKIATTRKNKSEEEKQKTTSKILQSRNNRSDEEKQLSLERQIENFKKTINNRSEEEKQKNNEIKAENSSCFWEVIDPNGNLYIIKNKTKFCKTTIPNVSFKVASRKMKNLGWKFKKLNKQDLKMKED